MNRVKRAACAALFAGLSWMGAMAAEFPDKPIKIIVPYAPGGGGDILARMYAEKLKAELGQPVIIDNKPGGGTLIGSELVAKSPADGYTLLLTTNSVLIAPILNGAAAKFDPLKDLTPVVPIGSIAMVLVAHPAVPANTAAELIAYLKKRPGKVSFASAGTGGITHLAGELFKTRAGVSMTHIPYKGAAPALNDLIGGQVELLFDAMITANPHIKSGKLKAIGLANAARWEGSPDIPTLSESGLPDFKMSGWYGVLAPAGTPLKVLERLNAESNKIIKSPEFAAKLRDAGLSPMGGDLEGYRKTVREEFGTWQKLIKDGNITID
ncbi:MAG: tripartite tricarboxylate transporter substrate binding protein [Betaproteobacteria bacterium]